MIWPLDGLLALAQRMSAVVMEKARTPAIRADFQHKALGRNSEMSSQLLLRRTQSSAAVGECKKFSKCDWWKRATSRVQKRAAGIRNSNFGVSPLWPYVPHSAPIMLLRTSVVSRGLWYRAPSPPYVRPALA